MISSALLALQQIAKFSTAMIADGSLGAELAEARLRASLVLHPHTETVPDFSEEP